MGEKQHISEQIGAIWLADGEPEHLPYEQLSSYLDNKLDEVDREIADSHLFICEQCTTDLADLRKYQKIAQTPEIEIEIPVAAKIEKERKSFWQQIFGGGFAPVFASGLAVLLVAAIVGAWFLTRSKQNESQIAHSNVNQNSAPIATFSPIQENINSEIVPPTTIANQINSNSSVQPVEPLLAVSDGGLTVDENGAVRGIESLSPAAQKAVRQSLQNGKVSVSPEVKNLGGGGGVLMSGDADSGVPFALQTPLGKVIRESQPVLRWKPLPNAKTYAVAIVDDKFQVVAHSGELTETNWKLAQQLPRGKNFSWQVTAVLPDGGEVVSPASPAPQARFRILDAAANSEIVRLENSATKSHLALGVLYAQNNFLTEARREFEILVRENPRSAVARRLLNSVKKSR